jgi:hypothetical protein
MALPTTLGGLEKKYVEIERELRELGTAKKKLEKAQDEILEAMQALCTAQRIESHRGARYTFAYVETEFAKTEDFKKVIAYVVESGEYDLLSERVKLTAARERWAMGKLIPGVVRVAEREFKARALPGKGA